MFIARQPIFKRNLEVFGYELLFRGSSDSQKFDGTSSESATASVIGGLFEIGVDQIVEDKCAFVNFDEKFIHSSSLELIPSDRLVIEMLENIPIDEQLLTRLRVLRTRGYKVALDDFVEKYSDYPLIRYADIIKFDIMHTPLHTINEEVHLALGDRKIILAEKVETKADFLLAKKMGFHLFQGYFFSKPTITAKSNRKTTVNSQYIRLLSELGKEEPSYQTLAEIIEQDANLSYRLIRISSSRSGDEMIYSIKKALTFMGLNEIERWVNVLMLQDIGRDKPNELTKISLIRSRFAELIVLHRRLPNIQYEATLMGLFSTLDAMLDMPMEDALEGVALPATIIDALLHKKGILYPIYELIISYEAGDWEAASELAAKMKIPESILFEKYLAAIRWTSNVFDRMY